MHYNNYNNKMYLNANSLNKIIPQDELLSQHSSSSANLVHGVESWSQIYNNFFLYFRL